MHFAYLPNLQHLNQLRVRLMDPNLLQVINDEHYNSRFQASIKRAVKMRETIADCKVLDIGTGSGILSLYAAQAGSRSIVACDSSPIMYSIARETFETAGISEHVTLRHCHAMNLTANDINGRADIVVTNIIQSNGIDADLLRSLIHAKRTLLNVEQGQVFPMKLTFNMVAFESQSIAQDNFCVNPEFEEVIYLKGCRLVSGPSTQGRSYEFDNANVQDMKFLTAVTEVFSCDFNDASDMEAILDGSKIRKVALPFVGSGFVDGFAMWFEVCVDDSDGPKVRNCWENMVFRLNHRFANKEELQALNVTISCPNGVWQIQHFYDYTGKTLVVGPDVVKFLNDIEYLRKLESDFSAAEPSNRPCYGNILDFSPFPYIGIGMLKERRAGRVYCSRRAEEVVRFVAKHNCLSQESIVFVDHPIDVLHLPDMFDVIVLNLINTRGCPRADQVSNYAVLKANKLSQGGQMIPHRIDVWCRPIASKWLRYNKTIVNPFIRRTSNMAAVNVINRLSSNHTDNLMYFEHKNLLEAQFCSELRLSDELYEKLITVPVDCMAHLDGFQYWFEIAFTANTPTISTMRNSSSFIRRACSVVDKSDTEVKDNQEAFVRYVQCQGMITITNYVKDLNK